MRRQLLQNALVPKIESKIIPKKDILAISK